MDKRERIFGGVDGHTNPDCTCRSAGTARSAAQQARDRAGGYGKTAGRAAADAQEGVEQAGRTTARKGAQGTKWAAEQVGLAQSSGLVSGLKNWRTHSQELGGGSGQCTQSQGLSGESGVGEAD